MRTQHVLTALALVITAREASASSFVATDSVTYSGAPVVTTLNSPNGTINPTVSYGISNAFNGAPIADNFPNNVATGAGGPFNFYDDYIFSIGAGGSTIQSALISFNTSWYGISNLQGRIIGVNGTFDPTANLGPPALGNTVIDRWSNTSPVAGINTVNLSATPFGPGTYDLQIRGDVAGTPPTGGYGGSITFTPVPLPASLFLLLTGIGFAGAMGKKRLLLTANVS